MKLIFPLPFLIFLLLIPISSASASILPPCTSTGNCGVCDFLWVISGFARWVLGIVGIGALLLFVYGGFMWITSGGVSGRVQKGQSIMTNTIIGIIIVVLAWTAINFIIASFAGPEQVKDSKVILKGMDRAWYEICTGEKDEECVGKGDGYPCNNRDGHCEKGVCQKGESACAWLADPENNFKAYQGWGCQNYKDCGLISYEECDTMPNCIRFLCPGGNENVCCKPK